jgi:hypothetical protein
MFYSYQHPPLRADEVTRESWQLVTAIHDKGDGLKCFGVTGKLWLHSTLLWLFQFCWN